MKWKSVLTAVLFWVGQCASSGLTDASEPPGPPETPATPPAHGKAGHVVLVVWDGLRPDLVRDETTPTLAKLARAGTFFAKHHSIYPTSTEVNGTALATGCFPQTSGIVGNREYRPEIEPAKPVDTQTLKIIRRGDELTGGKYLAVPTLPEMLHRTGARTVIAGSKPVAWLMDRAPREDGDAAVAAGSASVVDGESQPPQIAREATAAEGVFLKAEKPSQLPLPNTRNDAWTREALLKLLWHDELPKFSVLWLSEPDFSQHEFGIASPKGLQALASSDDQLAALLNALDARGWRDTTDVIVVSDHGFSTIGQSIDVRQELVAAGFSAHKEYAGRPKAGSIMVDGLGGTAYLYVAEHDEPTIARLTEFLQGSRFAGTIFTKQGLPGTFALSTAHIDSPHSPDVVVAMRWNNDKNAVGIPGTTISDGERKPGQGTHATLGPADVHNTCVATGPDFRVGFTSETPSSNADVAPTMAWILECPLSPAVDGRILHEALTGYAEASPLPAPQSERLEAAQDLPGGKWRQYLQVTRYGGEMYLDEGNGAFTVATSDTHPAGL